MTGWLYSKSITVSNPLATHVLSIKLNIGTGTDSGQNVYVDSGKVHADFADVRFTDTSDNPLAFYISEATATYAVFCVNCPAGDMVLWYGNSNATTAVNAAAVGTFTDGFDSKKQYLTVGDTLDSATQFTTWGTDSWADQMITRNGITYISWWIATGTTTLRVDGCTFNQVTKQYTEPITLFTTVTSTGAVDSHCIPALTIGSDGNFHLFVSAHSGQLYYKTASTFAGLTAATVVSVAVSGNAVYGTYLNAWCIGTVPYCFFRGGHSTQQGINYAGFVKYTGGAWSYKCVLANTYTGDDKRVYKTAHYDSATGKIHVICMGQTELFAAAGEDAYHGLFYLYSADGGDTWKTADDGLTYSGGTLPIDNNTATGWDTKLTPYIDAYAVSSMHSAITVNASGNPVILYSHYRNKTSPTANFYDTDHWLAEWNGSAWQKHALSTTGLWKDYCDISIIGTSYLVVGLKQNANGKMALRTISATSPTQTSDWTVGDELDGIGYANNNIMTPAFEHYTDNPTYRQFVYSSSNNSNATGAHGSRMHYRWAETDGPAWTQTNPNVHLPATYYSAEIKDLRGKLQFQAYRMNAQDTSMYASISGGAPSDFCLDIDFTVPTVSPAAPTVVSSDIHVSNTAGNRSAFGASTDAIRFEINSPTAASNTAVINARIYNNNTAQSVSIVVPSATKYYARLRTTNSRKAVKLSIYTDALRTTLANSGTAEATSASHATAIDATLTYLSFGNVVSTTSGFPYVIANYESISIHPTATTPPAISAWGSEVYQIVRRLKYYNGSGWIAGALKSYNGSAWVEHELKATW